MTFKSLILILMSGVLVNNYVLQKFLGICPFLGVSKKFDQASGMGIAVTFVMLCATAVTYPLQTFVLAPLKLEYLQTIVFILVIAALVQFVELVLKKFLPALHQSLGVYLPLITTNCAVLGVAINNVTDGYNFLESMFSSLGVGLGFLTVVFRKFGTMNEGVSFAILLMNVLTPLLDRITPRAFGAPKKKNLAKLIRHKRKDVALEGGGK